MASWEREMGCGESCLILGRRSGRRFAEGRGAPAASIAAFLVEEIQTSDECRNMLKRVRSKPDKIEGNAWDLSFADGNVVVLHGLYSGEAAELELKLLEDVLIGWLDVFLSKCPALSKPKKTFLTSR